MLTSSFKSIFIVSENDSHVFFFNPKHEMVLEDDVIVLTYVDIRCTNDPGETDDSDEHSDDELLQAYNNESNIDLLYEADDDDDDFIDDRPESELSEHSDNSENDSEEEEEDREYNSESENDESDNQTEDENESENEPERSDSDDESIQARKRQKVDYFDEDNSSKPKTTNGSPPKDNDKNMSQKHENKFSVCLLPKIDRK